MEVRLAGIAHQDGFLSQRGDEVVSVGYRTPPSVPSISLRTSGMGGVP
jgi:hypothetical protein